jgi:hypothetical protein
MTNYIAKLVTDAEYGQCDIKADTPEQALKLARTIWETDPDAIVWSGLDERQGLTDIAIMDEDETVLLEWQDPAESIRLAAPVLLEALEAQAMADAPRPLERAFARRE